MNKTRTTLDFYNNQAAHFSQSTRDVDFSALQNAFMSKVRVGGTILDLGTGSGRDARCFKDHGFQVVAIDGSAELAQLASEYLEQEVIVTTFQDYEPEQIFDGIWACASLLHLAEEELERTLSKLAAAIKTGGVFYASFKYGTYEGERNGRYFTDMTEERFAGLLGKTPSLKIEEQFITEDARPGRESEKWLNIFMRKSNA